MPSRRSSARATCRRSSSSSISSARARSASARSVKARRDAETILNFDGIGTPAPKIAGYEALSSKKLFNGFSLFYRLDSPLMKPKEILRLEPVVDFLLYQ